MRRIFLFFVLTVFFLSSSEYCPVYAQDCTEFTHRLERILSADKTADLTTELEIYGGRRCELRYPKGKVESNWQCFNCRGGLLIGVRRDPISGHKAVRGLECPCGKDHVIRARESKDRYVWTGPVNVSNCAELEKRLRTVFAEGGTIEEKLKKLGDKYGLPHSKCSKDNGTVFCWKCRQESVGGFKDTELAAFVDDKSALQIDKGFGSCKCPK
jgi:hypothetical protein